MQKGHPATAGRIQTQRRRCVARSGRIPAVMIARLARGRIPVKRNLPGAFALPPDLQQTSGATRA